MTCYIANHQKKLNTLARRREALLRLIHRNATTAELVMAAEAVRASQLRALEAKRAQIPPCDRSSESFVAIEAKIDACLALSVGDILASVVEPRPRQTNHPSG